MHYLDCDLLTLFLAVPDFRSGMNTSLETGNIGIESIPMSETAALDYSLAMCVCVFCSHIWELTQAHKYRLPSSPNPSLKTICIAIQGAQQESQFQCRSRKMGAPSTQAGQTQQVQDHRCHQGYTNSHPYDLGQAARRGPLELRCEPECGWPASKKWTSQRWR